MNLYLALFLTMFVAPAAALGLGYGLVALWQKAMKPYEIEEES